MPLQVHVIFYFFQESQMSLIDGKKVAQEKRLAIGEEVAKLKANSGNVPGLATVLVGEDPASAVYVRSKNKICKELGFISLEHTLPENTGEKDLLALVDELNRNEAISGILVQLPLPKHIDSVKILEAIDPAKDVDGFHPDQSPQKKIRQRSGSGHGVGR